MISADGFPGSEEATRRRPPMEETPEGGADPNWARRRPPTEEEEEEEETPPGGGDPTRGGRRRRPPAEMLRLLSAVVVWLVTGTTISSLNKWIFAVYNFRYPLLLSALHMLTAIVVDSGLMRLRRFGCGGAEGRDLSQGARCKVFLLSLTFCASIAFGNMGLNHVQLSFAQMIYTTTPLFTLAISTLVLGQQHHVLKYTAMMPICLGASCSILGEVQFDHAGCCFVFAATMLRGVKSIQQSILLQEEKINSVLLLYLMAVPSFCILAVAAVALENWALLEWPLHYDGHLWLFILLSCLGSVLYNLASSSVITLTSAVTLHILGNLSVVGNLLLSQLLFGSELSMLSCAGVVLTLSGMLIFQNSELIGDYLDTRSAAKAMGKEKEKEKKKKKKGCWAEEERACGGCEEVRARGRCKEEEEEDHASCMPGLTVSDRRERSPQREDRDKMD
ncbi:unnamed protein product [Merluccius merluccius]